MSRLDLFVLIAYHVRVHVRALNLTALALMGSSFCFAGCWVLVLGAGWDLRALAGCLWFAFVGWLGLALLGWDCRHWLGPEGTGWDPLPPC